MAEHSPLTTTQVLEGPKSVEPPQPPAPGATAADPTDHPTPVRARAVGWGVPAERAAASRGARPFLGSKVEQLPELVDVHRLDHMFIETCLVTLPLIG